MTEKERAILIDELAEEVIKRIGGNKQVTPRALFRVHDKWFRDDNGASYKSKMTQALGDPSKGWAIWELVRRATCVICGVQYVRQLKDPDKANEVADTICQLIYDLAVKERESK